MSLYAVFLAAVAFWGAGNPPPCGTPTLAVANLGPLAGGADEHGCRVYLDYEVADLRSRWTSQRYRCLVVFHEVGHLYRQRHRARGVMAPFATIPPPICRRLLPITWRERALRPPRAHIALP